MGQPFLVTLCFFEISPPTKTFHNRVPSHHSRPIFLQVPSVLKPNCTPANTLGFPALLYVFLPQRMSILFSHPQISSKEVLEVEEPVYAGLLMPSGSFIVIWFIIKGAAAGLPSVGQIKPLFIFMLSEYCPLAVIILFPSLSLTITIWIFELQQN